MSEDMLTIGEGTHITVTYSAKTTPNIYSVDKNGDRLILFFTDQAPNSVRHERSALSGSVHLWRTSILGEH